MSTINWRPIGVKDSEFSIEPRVEPSSEPKNKPTGSSTVPTPVDSCKNFTLALILGESHPINGTKRLAQPKILAVNLDESSSMPSVKGVGPVESSSADIHLPPKVGIKQVGECEKLSNSKSLQYRTEFSLDVIKAPKGGKQDIPTSQQVSSWQPMRR